MRDISDPEKQKLNINQRTFSICVVKELVCLEYIITGWEAEDSVNTFLTIIVRRFSNEQDAFQTITTFF